MQQRPPLISIVMPVYNGANLLGPTLHALTLQTISPEDMELIVVDDGSSDDPAAVFARFDFSFRHKLIRQPNAGLARARNRGIAEATGTIILFLDQDIIADQELVDAHAACHRLGGRALVGGRRVPWPPARTSLVTQILDLESTGGVPDATLAKHPYQVVIGANFSIPRDDVLAIGCFDEDFPAGGGFEDVDLAYRAYRAGLKVIYCQEAVGSHNHPKTLKDVCKSARRYNQSAQLLFSKHPELRNEFPYLVDKEPISWTNDPPKLIVRKTIRSMFALPAILWFVQGLTETLERYLPSPRLLRLLYRVVVGSHQLIGLREGAVELSN